jgi:hypothetical protein
MENRGLWENRVFRAFFDVFAQFWPENGLFLTKMTIIAQAILDAISGFSKKKYDLSGTFFLKLSLSSSLMYAQ